MRLRIVWRRTGPVQTRSDLDIPVHAAWIAGDWLNYRKLGDTDITHHVPSSAVDEVIISDGPSR